MWNKAKVPQLRRPVTDPIPSKKVAPPNECNPSGVSLKVGNRGQQQFWGGIGSGDPQNWRRMKLLDFGSTLRWPTSFPRTVNRQSWEIRQVLSYTFLCINKENPIIQNTILLFWENVLNKDILTQANKEKEKDKPDINGINIPKVQTPEHICYTYVSMLLI